MGIYSKLFGSQENPVGIITLDNPDEERALTAMRVLTSHVMIANEHNVIVNMNASVEAMLRSAEDDIRKELPHFAVDRLIGSSIDVFHKNPAHQTAVLARITAAHRADIRVGTRQFSLTATPILLSGRRLGTVIEWQDNTATNLLKQRELEQLERDSKKSEEMSLIMTALDTVSSNVMIAGVDGTILYANRAVRALLERAEDDIRAVLPAFRANDFVGRNFDVFHRNPAHQQTLLGRLTAPHETDIRVGVRHFRLLAAPIFGEGHKRLGTVVEWQDRTAEIHMEAAVESAIKAAIGGDLGVRINQSGYSGFLGKMATGINQLLNLFDGVLADAGNSLHALAKGNLHKRITNEYHGRYHSLKTDINATIERLQGVVTDIGVATTDVKQISQEFTQSNSSLSQRTEEQAACLEETSAAMAQITQALEQNSANAALAYDLSRTARDTAEAGGNIVDKAITAMNAISESGRRMGEIIGVIDGITFQTNLLALNAAVEAARAGDMGRGFAIVANEVRSLAGRSAKAAREIKELIRDSAGKIEEGVTLVNGSGQTLEQIIQSAKKVNDIIGEIAGSTQEQSKALCEINKAVQNMDDMTQQNSALVEEVASTSESLYKRAEALAWMMQFFDTRELGQQGY